MKRITSTLALVVGLAACGETPTAPPPTGDDPPAAVVSDVTVTSADGDLVAVGGVLGLDAVATTATGQTVGATFSWSTADATIATVTSTGSVQGVSAGTTTVTAMADGVAGTFGVTVADADLAAIEAVLNDTLGLALLPLVDVGAGGSLRSAWTDCVASAGAGALQPLQLCVAAGRSSVASDTAPERGPVRALVSLFLDSVERLLNLT